jgi:hypothetical protein
VLSGTACDTGALLRQSMGGSLRRVLDIDLRVAPLVTLPTDALEDPFSLCRCFLGAALSSSRICRTRARCGPILGFARSPLIR